MTERTDKAIKKIASLVDPLEGMRRKALITSGLTLAGAAAATWGINKWLLRRALNKAREQIAANKAEMKPYVKGGMESPENVEIRMHNRGLTDRNTLLQDEVAKIEQWPEWMR